MIPRTPGERVRSRRRSPRLWPTVCSAQDATGDGSGAAATVIRTCSRSPVLGDRGGRAALMASDGDSCRRVGRRHPAGRRHAAPAAAAGTPMPTRCSASTARSRARASTGASTACRSSGRKLVESLLDPDWAERGALVGALTDERAASGSSRSATTFACAIRHSQSRPSPSPTRSRGEASARGCSSGWPRGPPRSASSASSPRCSPRTTRCSASSSGRASS